MRANVAARSARQPGGHFQLLTGSSVARESPGLAGPAVRLRPCPLILTGHFEGLFSPALGGSLVRNLLPREKVGLGESRVWKWQGRSRWPGSGRRARSAGRMAAWLTTRT